MNRREPLLLNLAEVETDAVGETRGRRRATCRRRNAQPELTLMLSFFHVVGDAETADGFLLHAGTFQEGKRAPTAPLFASFRATC